jgi:hypothetical protein
VKEKVTEALLLIIAVAVAARVVFGLLRPLLPTLIGLLTISYVIYSVLRRR